mmetsp:Transcript_8958/g.23437  ORF Transcript_8958/g.23437 Transcript_8958/m.23437 type:complete len:98 (-) Transcript_8958:400-693(-)
MATLLESIATTAAVQVGIFTHAREWLNLRREKKPQAKGIPRHQEEHQSKDEAAKRDDVLDHGHTHRHEQADGDGGPQKEAATNQLPEPPQTAITHVF